MNEAIKAEYEDHLAESGDVRGQKSYERFIETKPWEERSNYPQAIQSTGSHIGPEMVCPVVRRLSKMLNGAGDPMLNEMAKLLQERSQVGIAKYKTTLGRKDLTRKDWMQHALEEALDLMNYAEAEMLHHGESEWMKDIRDNAIRTASILLAEMKGSEGRIA